MTPCTASAIETSDSGSQIGLRQLPRPFPTSIPPQAQYQRETTPRNRDVLASLVLGQLIADVERTDFQRARNISCASSRNVESIRSAEALSVTPPAWERECRPNLSIFPQPPCASEGTFRALDNLRPQSSTARVLRRNDDSVTDRAIEGFENVEALHEESSSSGEEIFPEVFGPRNNPGDPDILSTRPTPLPLTPRPAKRKDEITSAPRNIPSIYSPSLQLFRKREDNVRSQSSAGRIQIASEHGRSFKKCKPTEEDSSREEKVVFEIPGSRTGVPQIRTPTTHDSMTLPERPLGDTRPLPRPAAETPRSHTYMPDILCPQPIRTWQIADGNVADVDRAQTQSNVFNRRGSQLRGDPAIERIRGGGRVSPLNLVSQRRSPQLLRGSPRACAERRPISPTSPYLRLPYMPQGTLQSFSKFAHAQNPRSQSSAGRIQMYVCEFLTVTR
ncbi:hypothetical protein GGX14DRAFT_462940 [Mycena pura]|uniref:Uncharacterized protein n=1 Tax=Mycena pura TaxID=153505 RepID=A0AAD6V539_9AGAR|nr:hypothetical protein GGX14DRAFT_462940 [Mycena pura]